MGLRKIYIDYIEQCARQTIGGLSGKRMLELGNQQTKPYEGLPEKTGKEYYSNRGVEHTSVDMNGRDGAVKLDLGKPIPFTQWRSYYDIVTNLGTCEHVGPPKKAQYQCFKNIHDCLKIGGIAVHIGPGIQAVENNTCWKGHSNYYYSREFFETLAGSNNYTLISFDVNAEGLIFACVRKNQDAPFMPERKAFLKHIAVRGLPKIYAGINDRGIYRLVYVAYCCMKAVRRLLGLPQKKSARSQEQP